VWARYSIISDNLAKRKASESQLRSRRRVTAQAQRGKLASEPEHPSEAPALDIGRVRPSKLDASGQSLACQLERTLDSQAHRALAAA
jgi:hypothetical protein